jgi:hypothetical protein
MGHLNLLDYCQTAKNSTGAAVMSVVEWFDCYRYGQPGTAFER